MKKLKKLFGKVSGTAEDGSTIYEYDELAQRDWLAPEYAEYMEEIEAYFDQLYPNRETSVMHEILSDRIHLDVHVKYPTDEEPFYVLFTTGMSALRMNVPTEVPDRQNYELAELMVYLPADWELGKPGDLSSDIPETGYWIIGYMKWLARFPHEYNTFLGSGHTIPNGADYEPFAAGTTLGGTLLTEMIDPLTLDDGSQINFYHLTLAYQAEIEYKLQYGMDALLAKFEAADTPIVTDLTRPNVCESVLS